MAHITIEVSDEIARRYNGALASGRDAAVILWLSRRQVIEAIIGDSFANERIGRTFRPDTESLTRVTTR